jgi:hypothetical protein
MLSENTSGYMFIQIKSFNVIIDVGALNSLDILSFMIRDSWGSFIAKCRCTLMTRGW